MRPSRLLFGVGVLGVVLAGFVACTGDDPIDPVTVSPDGAADGGSDSSTSTPEDAGAEGSTPTDGATPAKDGSIPCEGGVPNVSEATIDCPGVGSCTARAQTCCAGPDPDAGFCITNGNPCPTGKPKQCVRAGQCATGSLCCLGAANVKLDVCPATGDLAATECRVGPTCNGGEIELCAGTEPCHTAGTTCQIFGLSTPDLTPIGACL